MTINPALYSSDRGDWATPPHIFDYANRRWGPFTLDVAADKGNAMCKRYLSSTQDGLLRSWGMAKVWLNPPYGRGVGKWLRKAWNETHYHSCRGVVILIPARTDTSWWHEWATLAQEVVFIRGRITFVGAPAPAPFPSAFVVYRPIAQMQRAPLYDTWSPRPHGRTQRALRFEE